MNVLVSGGAGSLARYCLEELQRAGHTVTLFDQVRPENAAVPWSPAAPIILGDLTNPADCSKAVEASRADAIVHLGAIPFSSEDPERRKRDIAAGKIPLPADLTFRVNVLGTYNIGEAARRANVKTIVFASSMCVIEGPGRDPAAIARRVPGFPLDESAPMWGEQSYHLSKILGEETLLALSRAHDIRVAAIRMMWVYMPHGGQAQKNMMHLGEAAVPPNPGTFAVWEYLDARDAAVAYRLALEATNLGPFESFYIATDRMCLEEHRSLIQKYYPAFAADAEKMGPDDLILSIRKARTELGYRPRHSWRGPEANDLVR